MKFGDSTILLITILSVVIAGLGIGYMISGGLNDEHPSASAQNTYNLNLVVTTENWYNQSVGTQPAFFVLGANGLESSANITIPSFTKINLTIFNYDDGNGSLAPQYANVTGTVGGVETYFNNTMINSTQASSIAINGSATASSVPIALISHTFTITNKQGQVLVNIPVPLSSVVHATFYLNQSGSYLWQCEVNCGSGPTGWDGAMASPGWMCGYFNVEL